MRVFSTRHATEMGRQSRSGDCGDAAAAGEALGQTFHQMMHGTRSTASKAFRTLGAREGKTRTVQHASRISRPEKAVETRQNRLRSKGRTTPEDVFSLSAGCVRIYEWWADITRTVVEPIKQRTGVLQRSIEPCARQLARPMSVPRIAHSLDHYCPLPSSQRVT